MRIILALMVVAFIAIPTHASQKGLFTSSRGGIYTVSVNSTTATNYLSGLPGVEKVWISTKDTTYSLYLATYAVNGETQDVATLSSCYKLEPQSALGTEVDSRQPWGIDSTAFCFVISSAGTPSTSQMKVLVQY